ncbi:MAG TPA: HEAT repeat domain-containing protein [Gemmatimonadaceae bacterium]
MINTVALVVVGSFQAVFIVATLVLLIAAHRHGRREGAADEAAVDALRGPVRALMLGEDHGESLAATLAQLDHVVATRRLLSIAVSQLAPEQLRDLAARVRPAAWVERTLAGGASRRWWKRMEAARLLAVVNSPADLPLLARLLTDPHPAVASAATGAIAGHADAALIEAIIRGLSEQPTAVRLQQMRALRTHADVATRILVAQLDAGGRADQVRALVQLAETLGTPGALAATVPFASHGDAEVRATVARALRLCFMPAGVEAARRLLADTDWRVRAAAARALGGLSAVDAIPDLRAAMRDEWWWVRFRAALALGALGEDGASALAAATSSDDEFARDMAVVVRDLPESARLELST